MNWRIWSRDSSLLSGASAKNFIDTDENVQISNSRFTRDCILDEVKIIIDPDNDLKDDYMRKFGSLPDRTKSQTVSSLCSAEY